MDETIRLKMKIAAARFNLMFMIALSVINILFISSGKDLMMPFSSSIATYAAAFGIKAAIENGNEAIRFLGLAISCVVLLILLICHLLSKRKEFCLFIAFALLIADTLVLIILSIAIGNFQLLTVLDIFLHVLTSVYIINAVKAHSKLRKLPGGTDDQDLDDVDQADEKEDELSEYKEEDYDDEKERPMRDYQDDGSTPVVSGKCNGLNVFTVISNGTAMLVINGYVCDELAVDYVDEYQLRAIVNGIDFVFEYQRSGAGEASYLYANNELLDSFRRD